MCRVEVVLIQIRSHITSFSGNPSDILKDILKSLSLSISMKAVRCKYIVVDIRWSIDKFNK